MRESIPSDNTLCPYQLVLWDSRDEYSIDLDEPTGFEIICRKDDEDYKQIIQAIHRTRRKHRWEEFKYTIKYKLTKILKNKV